MSGKHGRVRAGHRPLPARTGRPSRRPAAGRRPPAAASRGRSWAAAAGSRAIFRKEALEFHARGRELTGGVVRLGAGWLRWSYRLTLALVAAGAAAVMLIPAGQSSYGPAVIHPRSGRFAALFPAAVATDLAAATGLSFRLPGAGLQPARVTGVRVRLAGPAAISKAGLAMPGQPSILVSGRLVTARPAGAAGPLHTAAAVILPARPVAAVLAHELQVMLGQAGAGH